MQRINLAWFAELGVRLEPLTEHTALADDKRSIHVVTRAKEYVQILADHKRFPLSLKASRPAAAELIRVIDLALTPQGSPPEPGLTEYAQQQVWLAAYRFENILNGELAVQAVYLLWPKRAYDTDILIDDGTKIFSEVVRNEFTAIERADIEQAGKCLAVEVATSAAFHIFRATESIIRRYYEVVVGSAPKPKMRNWGAYIRNLKACNADPKVTSVLEQIKDLYRNPVIHPDIQIEIDEALSLVGIAESAISRMVADMKDRKAKAIPPALPFRAASLLTGTKGP